MLETRQFGEELRQRGVGLLAGVPCSLLKDLINDAINASRYVMAANEGDAVAIASGVALAGQRAGVLMQNSGLANAVSPLTSLNHTFGLPVLGFVGWRGEPGTADEPQHELMGAISERLLALLEVSSEVLSDETREARQQLDRAQRVMDIEGRPFVFLVRRGTFSPVSLERTDRAPAHVAAVHRGAESGPLSRTEVLQCLARWRDEPTVLLATTGMTGRELAQIDDAPNNLYMVGSLGCVSSLGLGLALARPDLRVVAIDGDGSLLMRMGSLATNGFYRPRNLLHLLLDNHCHDSTGGQATVSEVVDFPAVAAASGYTVSASAGGMQDVEAQLRRWRHDGGLTFLAIDTAPGSAKALGRPQVGPREVRERFMRFIGA